MDRNEEYGGLTIDLRELLRQEEELQQARQIIAEQEAQETIEGLDDPEGLPKLRIVYRRIAAFVDAGAKK